LGLRHGAAYFYPDPYPNGIFFNRMFSNHWDPLADPHTPHPMIHIKLEQPLPHTYLAMSHDKFPRACSRTINIFKRCQMINGKEKCAEEANDIIEICPNWCLDSLKEGVK